MAWQKFNNNTWVNLERRQSIKFTYYEPTWHGQGLVARNPTLLSKLHDAWHVIFSDWQTKYEVKEEFSTKTEAIEMITNFIKEG